MAAAIVWVLLYGAYPLGPEDGNRPTFADVQTPLSE